MRSKALKASVENIDHQPFTIQKQTEERKDFKKSAHFAKYLFEKESDEHRNIVKKVGKAFNEELNKGKYQTFFTSY